MRCTNCRAELPDESSFCSECGQAISIVDHREEYSIKTSSSEDEILLEGLCTFWYFEPSEMMSADGSDCKFQLTKNSIRFVPFGIFSFGSFGKSDSMELPLNRIKSVRKTRYNLFFPAVELVADDESTFKFAGFGKIGKVYNKICEMCRFN